MLFSGIGYGILRAEGDARRTMYALGFSAVVNAILDPVLIYSLGMGIAGAAWATVISLVLVCALIGYWLFVRKDTYISFSRREFSPDRRVVSDIMGVGLPASAEMFLIAILTAIINAILVFVSGTDAVAVYTTGWRVVMLAFVPIMGIGAALVSVSGAAYGARRFFNVGTAHSYSIKLGTIIMVLIAVLTFVLAPAITTIFTYSAESAHLAPSITAFLRVMCIFYIFVPLGSMSSMLFQGVGKGMTSLILTLIREIILLAVFAYLLAVTLGWGEVGVWWGIVVGQVIGSIIAFVWARQYLHRLIQQNGSEAQTVQA
jgi:putative MATE family efflux protein